MATIKLMFDDVELAAKLVGATEAQREKAGGGWGPQTLGDFDVRAMLTERFDEERADELIAPGRLMELAEAAELALSDSKD